MSEMEVVYAAEAKANQWAGQRETLTKQLAEAGTRQEFLLSQMDVYTEAIKLLEHSGAVARMALKESIESLVTQALVMIYQNPDYRFIVEFKTRRNQVEVDFKVRRGLIEAEPLDSMGGGVCDVVAIALRFLMMELLQVPGPFILDEPAKYVSADYIKNVAMFLHQYSHQTGRQIILVTHRDEMAQLADTLVRVTHDGQKSCVEVQAS